MARIRQRSNLPHHMDPNTMRPIDIFAPQMKRTVKRSEPRFRISAERDDKRAGEIRRRNARLYRQTLRVVA